MGTTASLSAGGAGQTIDDGSVAVLPAGPVGPTSSEPHRRAGVVPGLEQPRQEHRRDSRADVLGLWGSRPLRWAPRPGPRRVLLLEKSASVHGSGCVVPVDARGRKVSNDSRIVAARVPWSGAARVAIGARLFPGVFSPPLGVGSSFIACLAATPDRSRQRSRTRDDSPFSRAERTRLSGFEIRVGSGPMCPLDVPTHSTLARDRLSAGGAFGPPSSPFGPPASPLPTWAGLAA